MSFTETVLYKRDAKGSIREWSIRPDYNNNLIIIRYGQYKGITQEQTELVGSGKASRTIQMQIDLRIQSRIASQLDKGYSASLALATVKPLNTLGLLRPMLAQKFEDNKQPFIDFCNAYVQRKYDGNRCLIANVDGKLIAYTRNGKELTTLDHILKNLILPDNTILDGELYAHGVPLQTIVSWVKKEQPETKQLRYLVYDQISDLPFAARIQGVQGLLLPVTVQVAETIAVSSYNEVIEHYKRFRQEKYEGAILRHTLEGYEDSKRSFSLLKIKGWQDTEVQVIGIQPSADDWAVLTCRFNDKVFKVSAPGTIEEKKNTLKNRAEFLGRYVTIEYAYLTKDGKPFHPIAKAWRST